MDDAVIESRPMVVLAKMMARFVSVEEVLDVAVRGDGYQVHQARTTPSTRHDQRHGSEAKVRSNRAQPENSFTHKRIHG